MNWTKRGKTWKATNAAGRAFEVESHISETGDWLLWVDIQGTKGYRTLGQYDTREQAQKAAEEWKPCATLTDSVTGAEPTSGQPHPPKATN